VSEGYQAKQQRWLELAAGLPLELSGRVALRNVEADPDGARRGEHLARRQGQER